MSTRTPGEEFITTEDSKHDEKAVDEAAIESFPASDAPAWTSSVRVGPPVTEAVTTETPRDVRYRLRYDLDALQREPRREYIERVFLDADRLVTLVPTPRAPENVEALHPGVEPGDEIVVGARYDVDDASGLGVILSLVRVLAGRSFVHPVRIVALSDTASYARWLTTKGVRLRGAILLERVGFERPPGLVASRRGFAAVVGDRRSRALVRDIRDAFRNGAELRIHAIALPGFVPLVAGEARVFWRERYPAALVTDTGPLVGPRRRRAAARGTNVDAMTDIVFGMASVVAHLAGGRH